MIKQVEIETAIKQRWSLVFAGCSASQPLIESPLAGDLAREARRVDASRVDSRRGRARDRARVDTLTITVASFEIPHMRCRPHADLWRRWCRCRCGDRRSLNYSS